MASRPRWLLSAQGQGQIRFLLGVAGIIYETVIEHVDRPWLLALFGGLCGVDKVIEWQTRLRSDGKSQT